MFNVQKVINKGVKANGTVFVDTDGNVLDRSNMTTLSASRAGLCLRQSAFMMHGFEPDPHYENKLGYAMRGDAVEAQIELRIRQGLEGGKIKLLDSGEDQKTLIHGMVSGTPDGLLTGLEPDSLAQYGVTGLKTKSAVVEFKSFDPRMDITEPKPAHAIQAKINIALYRECTNHAPLVGLVIYVNASDFEDVHVFAVDYDPELLAKMQIRAQALMDASNPTHASAEGKWSGQCEYCAYTAQCADATVREVPKANAVDELPLEAVEELDGLCEQYAEALAAAKEWEAHKKKVGSYITDLLKEHGCKSTKTGTWSTSVAVVAGRKSLDVEAMKDDGLVTEAMIEKYSKQGNPYERLTVKAT